MGYTFRPEEGRGGDAMEGKFCDRRTDALSNPDQGRGEYGLTVPCVFYHAEDGIRDPGPLRAVRCGGVERSRPPATSLLQPTAGASGSRNRGGQTRKTPLGSTQDPRTPPATIAFRSKGPSLQHHSRDLRSTWSGRSGKSAQDAGPGNAALPRLEPE